MTAQKHWDVLVSELKQFSEESNHNKFVIGISGGFDSALVATLAAEVVGHENVLGVSMPSKYTSEESIFDGQILCEWLGMELREIPIEPIVNGFQQALPLEGIAAENLQARVRGTLLMGIANTEHRVVLATGNLSEILTGYCTMYGDTVGGFAPLGSSLKSECYEVAEWLNEDQPRIPENILRKPPSAELAPGQKDSDSLPPYDILDKILTGYLAGTSPNRLRTAFGVVEVDGVLSRIGNSAWKRNQLPPAPSREAIEKSLV